MSPEQQQRIRAIFDQALVLPEAHRLPYLQSASAGDTEVFETAARLLRAHEQAQSFLETIEPPAAPATPQPMPHSGVSSEAQTVVAPRFVPQSAPAPQSVPGLQSPPSPTPRPGVSSEAQTVEAPKFGPQSVPGLQSPPPQIPRPATSPDAQTVEAPKFGPQSAPRPQSATPPISGPPSPAPSSAPPTGQRPTQGSGTATGTPGFPFLPQSQTASSQTHAPGEQWIGIYRIIRTLGEGGMGTVYLAMRSDDAFRKIVALKLIRRDRATPDFIERFRQERQLLAGLDHPNIARILDGGSTEDGSPYYVMDFVEGAPLDEYCESNKLDAPAILGVFRQVCSAVQYLHDNLVVHRDLKPSNIMVTREGTAKLLDFGIATFRGLPGHGAGLDDNNRILTPAYASPEQMRGESVDKASDIYALGAILYELLTGGPSYKDSEAKYAAITSGVEPNKPSSRVQEHSARLKELAPRLRRSLAGDLDAIILTALQTAPGRRYPTASALSDDIQRYLEGKPISVRKGSPIERSAKFTKRHPVPVAAAGVVLLLAGFGGFQAASAYAQRNRADAKEVEIERLLNVLQERLQTDTGPVPVNDVQRIQTVLQTELPQVLALRPGVTERRKLLVEKAVSYLTVASEKSGHDPALDLQIASALKDAGDLQSSDPRSQRRRGLGDAKAAANTYRAGGMLLSTLAAQNPGDRAIHSEIAQVNSRLSAIGAEPLPPVKNEAVAAAPEVAPTTTPTSHPVEAHSPAKQVVESAPAPVVATAPAPPPEPAPAPRVDPAVAEVRQRYASVAARVQTAEAQIDPIRKSVAARGQSLNPDLANAISRMKSDLEEAKQDMAQGDLAAARESLDRAEAFAGRVLKAVGR
jgi:serine/threonine protein kinase